MTEEELLARRWLHLAMYFYREVGQKSLTEIADVFDVKYPTVSVACERVRDRMSSDRRFTRKLVVSKESIINVKEVSPLLD